MNRLLAVLCLLLLGLLAACSAGTDTMSDVASDGGGDAAGLAPAAPRPNAAELEAPDEAGGDIDAGTPGRARTAPQTRAVISKGTVSLHARDVTAARFDVLEVVDRHGGEVSDEETSTDDEGELRFARMVLRVPSAQFDTAMRDLAQVAELEATSRSSEDVTTQVIDTAARIRAQERSLRRIEALLAEADDLREVIEIESQLARRQADLDSLKQQLAWLEDQSSMSRITVHLDRSPEPREEEDGDRAGFLTGLEEGWDALAAFVVGGSRVVGAVLPFAVLLAVVGALLLPVARRVRRRVAAARVGAGRAGADQGDPGPAGASRAGADQASG